uniref:Uncharacterized protein n=2 Tax=Gammaproteobacteria TaxID=1236 RepID=A0A3G4RWE9_ECOLX|nr:hypothetical protein D0378_00064 [Escherichia coli]
MRQQLPVSAEPAGAVSGCRYGPMRENPGLAATVPVAPPLSRRGLRSLHPGKKPPGCKGQRRFAHALFVVAAGPETQQMMGAENIRYRRNYERIFF